MRLIDLAERGLLPDWLIRIGIRRLLATRLIKERLDDVESQRESQERFIDGLRESPIVSVAGFVRCLRQISASRAEPSNSNAGEYSSWPVPNCSA